MHYKINYLNFKMFLGILIASGEMRKRILYRGQLSNWLGSILQNSLYRNIDFSGIFMGILPTQSQKTALISLEFCHELNSTH